MNSHGGSMPSNPRAKQSAVKPKNRARSGRSKFAKGRGTTATWSGHADGGDETSALFEILRKVRKQIADENSWPAYVVLSDRTLKDLAAQMPQSLSDLHNVFGFGEKKIEKFGQRFVDAVKEYLGR